MMAAERVLTAPVCLSIGVFDGVHVGHQHLIRSMVTQAKEHGLVSACLTFDPDPEAVLVPDHPPLALSTVEERVERIRDLGVAHIQVLPFTTELAHQTAYEFLAGLRARYDLRTLCVGSDFALGRERTGTVDVLQDIGQQLGFAVSPTALLEAAGRPVSSTWIRELLAAGDVERASELLGRPYCLEGRVETGMQRGRQLGFPTANVRPPSGRALPADGVYFVRASRTDSQSSSGETWNGVVNLGSRPTFDEHERLLETYLLDFTGDLYGAELRVCFIKQLRGIQRFSGIDELKAQIEKDVVAARQLAGGHTQA
jgi:riboflavin kinase / FMN adenylyltransferase